MSLLYYEERFSRLNPNRSNNHVSPHKVAMMLSVMDLVEAEAITDNRIPFDERLLGAFTRRFNELRSDSDGNNPHLPFFHLQSERFWHIELIPGRVKSWEDSTRNGVSARKIREHVLYAYLDDELFELLRNRVVRELLRTALYRNLRITDSIRRESLKVDGWDWLECEACVADYFSMLSLELKGKKYNKSRHRSALLEKLNGRSEGAIERKHQNVSAILIQLRLPYISGYKPLPNYQSQLKEVVIAHLAAFQGELAPSTSIQLDTHRYTSDWGGVLDSEIPERLPYIPRPERKFVARMGDFTKREAINRHLGELGEQFVIEFEKYKLTKAGRSDLAKEVEWSSKEKGDGLGYDVRSFLVDESSLKEEELFIEVKTTSCGKYLPFYITDNELAFSKKFSDNYQLSRVYDFHKKARIFQLTGSVEEYVNLHPELYRASFSEREPNT